MSYVQKKKVKDDNRFLIKHARGKTKAACKELMENNCQLTILYPAKMFQNQG